MSEEPIEYEVKEVDGVVYRRPKYRTPPTAPVTAPPAPPVRKKVRTGNALYFETHEE